MFKLTLCPRIWSVLVDVPRDLERNVCPAVVGWSVLQMSPEIWSDSWILFFIHYDNPYLFNRNSISEPKSIPLALVSLAHTHFIVFFIVVLALAFFSFFWVCHDFVTLWCCKILLYLSYPVFTSPISLRAQPLLFENGVRTGSRCASCSQGHGLQAPSGDPAKHYRTVCPSCLHTPTITHVPVWCIHLRPYQLWPMTTPVTTASFSF